MNKSCLTFLFAFALCIIHYPANAQILKNTFSKDIPISTEHIFDTQLHEKINSIDSLLNKTNSSNKIEEADLLCQKARLYISKNYYSTAISLFDQALDLLQNETGTLDKRINILLEQSLLYEPYGEIGKGIEKLYELLKLAQDDYPEQKAYAYTALGHLYILLNNRMLSKECLDSTQNILQRNTNIDKTTYNELQYRLNNVLANLWSEHDVDSAFFYLQKAEDYAQKDIDKIQIIYQNKAVLYAYQKDFNTSETYFKKAIVLIEDDYQKLCVYCNLAELEKLKGNYKSALNLYKEALEKAIKIPSVQVQVQTMSAMAEIYCHFHNYQKAYFLLHKAKNMSDSSAFMHSRKQIVTIQRDFELFKLENEKRLYSYQNEVSTLKLFKKNIIIVLFFLILSVSISVGVITYRKLGKQRSRSEQLSRLLRKKISEENQTVNHLKDEADRRLRELVSNTIRMARYSELISEILPKVELLKHQNKDSKTISTLNEIQNKLRSLNEDKKQWEDFKIYFEQVHPAFFSRLHQAFPNLTAGENRICALIVMNLNTKEIATLTNRSLRTIDTIRFRIRKKMGIDENISTLSFLQSFTHPEENIFSQKQP